MSAGYVRRASRALYENPWLRFEAHEIVHPSGAPGEHGLVAIPAASAVVVLDGDFVLLTSQPRFAIDRVVLEIVKGSAHPGEDALTCARRECREEVGRDARRWDALGTVWEIPSIVDQAVTLFLARDLIEAPAPPEAVESIATVRVRFEEALTMATDGRIGDAVSIAALFRAERLRRGR